MEELKPLLNPQQEQFCINYTSKGDFYSNAVLSYADAYGFVLKLREDGKVDYTQPEYNTCNVSAIRLLQTAKIKERIQNIYLEYFNDNAMDARVSEIALKGNEANSIQAVKIFNDLKQRITKKLDITTAGRPLSGLSDDELDKLSQ